MTVKRVNSTGRCKILRDDARISLRLDTDGSLTFGAVLDFNEYDLPNESQVFIEAYRQTTFMRFPFGTIAVPHAQPEINYRLKDFSTDEGLLFRVKVTSVGERSGLLLAEADRIRPVSDEEQPDNRIALLPPVPADLGDELWKVTINENSGPVLQINERVDDWKSLASSPLFRSLVYPTAMREVLWHIVVVRGTHHIDDESDWACRWLKFAQSLPGVGDKPDADDTNDWLPWIDGAVESFTRRHEMLKVYKAAIAAGVPT